MKLAKSLKLGTLLCATLMLVTGCQTTTTPTSAIDKRVYCELFPERSYSRHDTEETRRHIVGDNAAKRELCKGV